MKIQHKTKERTNRGPWLILGTGAVILALAGGVWLGTHKGGEPVAAVEAVVPLPPVLPKLPEPPGGGATGEDGIVGTQPAAAMPVTAVLAAPRVPTSFDRRPASLADTERLEAALARLAGSSEPTRMAELAAIGGELAATATVAELRGWLEHLPDAADRRALVRGYLQALTALSVEEGISAALDISTALVSDPSFGPAEALAIAVDVWAGTDPAAVAGWASGLQGGRERAAVWNALIQKWASADPGAALAWVGQLAGEGDYLAMRIGQISSQKDAGAAVQALFALADGPARDAYLAGIVPAWIGLDAATAMQAVETISDRGRKATAVHQAVLRWAHLDPSAAAEWTMNYADPGLRRSLQENIARAWSARDPEAALAWAATQDDPELREALVSAAAPQAIWRNPELALRTVAALPEGRKRDAAASQLAVNWAQRDPAAAAAWAATAELVAGQRHTVVADVAYQWARRSPEQAAAWLAGVPVGNSRYSGILATAAGAADLRDGESINAWRQIMRSDNLDSATVQTWLRRSEVPEAIRLSLQKLASP